MQHIFIVGSKGIPGAYGGYETFVDKLTEYHQNDQSIKYHVACKSNESGEVEYHNARCFKVKVPNVGPAQAIYYDVAALQQCCKHIEKNNITNPIVYILACRIGPFAAHYQRRIHKYGGKVFVNPDGHEWLRTKWSAPVRKYWKISEQMMVKHSDLLVCDSKNIEKYIRQTYQKYRPNTEFIAYGAEMGKSRLANSDPVVAQWYKDNRITAKQYYLIVGRLVPENNYETMIREFMKSKSTKDLIVVSTENNEYLEELEKKLHFHLDKRIKFVGSVYDQELLKKIRENAYGYIHGHEVGGTNPSLLEALSFTDLNLLLDVCFNREVGENATLYWNKKEGCLAMQLELADSMNLKEYSDFGIKAKLRIANIYNWKQIADKYKMIFSCND